MIKRIFKVIMKTRLDVLRKINIKYILYLTENDASFQPDIYDVAFSQLFTMIKF